MYFRIFLERGRETGDFFINFCFFWVEGLFLGVLNFVFLGCFRRRLRKFLGFLKDFLGRKQRVKCRFLRWDRRMSIKIIYQGCLFSGGLAGSGQVLVFQILFLTRFKGLFYLLCFCFSQVYFFSSFVEQGVMLFFFFIFSIFEVVIFFEVCWEVVYLFCFCLFLLFIG